MEPSHPHQSGKLDHGHDPLVRTRVYQILLETANKNKTTPEYKMFLRVNHEDPLVEAVRRECKTLYYIDGQLSEGELEKLKGFAEKLKQQP